MQLCCKHKTTDLPSLRLVTTYLGPYCSYNGTELIAGTCTSVDAGSYSVDCPDLNGSINASYTTISASSSTLFWLSTLSGSESSTSSAAASTTILQSPTSSPALSSTSFRSSTFSPSLFSTTRSQSSTFAQPLSSATSFQSPITSSTSSTTDFQSPPSSATSSSLSSTSSLPNNTGSSRGGRVHLVKIIVPSVVAPISLIIISLFWWKWCRKSRRGDAKDKGDRKKSMDHGSLPGIEMQHYFGQNPVENTHIMSPPASDAESAHSEFSITIFPQVALKNRTAEPDSP